MRKLALGLVMLAGLLVTGCAERIGTAERLTLVNQTIASTARVTETALAQGQIDWQAACFVEVYSRLASAAVDAGFHAYVTGDPEGAAGHLLAAQGILAGVSVEASNQAEEECT